MRTPRLRWLKWIAIGILIVPAALTLLLAIIVFTTLTPPPPAASRSTIRVLVAVATAIIAAELLALPWGIWWLWWRLPQRQVARLAISISDPKARADAENNFRRTVGQALGGAAVLIGVGVAYLQLMRQQDATHDLLISDQVSKGFEQLAADKLPMRLGDIYALEGVMNG